MTSASQALLDPRLPLSGQAICLSLTWEKPGPKIAAQRRHLSPASHDLDDEAEGVGEWREEELGSFRVWKLGCYRLPFPSVGEGFLFSAKLFPFLSLSFQPLLSPFFSLFPSLPFFPSHPLPSAPPSSPPPVLSWL